MIITLRPSIPSDIQELAPHVRQADRDELQAIAFASPEEAMMRGMKDSEVCMTGLIDNVPVCMWGIVRESLINGIGIPWMVATSHADTHATVFLRECRDGVIDAFRNFKHLVNYVDARNKRAIQWLIWLGFTIEAPAPNGVMMLPFHKFTMNPAKVADHGGLIIKKCAFAELEFNRNFPKLAAEYAKECGIHGLPAPDEKVAAYRLIDSLDVFQSIGAFLNRKLVGFVCVMTPMIPHYGVCIATTESIFVGSDYRHTGAGIRLIEAAERHAKDRKAPGYLFCAPHGGILAKILPRRGYRKTNEVFFKELSYE